MSQFEWLAGEIQDLRNDVRRLERTVARLREALMTAQGEAYLGGLEGDDTPSPLAACSNVIDVCLKALA